MSIDMFIVIDLSRLVFLPFLSNSLGFSLNSKRKFNVEN